jgi:N-acylneuraminate cytidylyltransferase
LEVHEPYNAPRQSLPQVYWQTGHVDVIRTRTIREKNSLTGDRVLPVRVDSRLAVDIDTISQLRLAEEMIAAGELKIVRPAGAGAALLECVRLLVFDFDGVFTDNRVHVDAVGRELVSCSRSDGLGIERLLENGLDAAVLSTEANAVVTARCRKLKVFVQQGLRDKGLAFLETAGVAIAPADANPVVLRMVDLVLSKRGGEGAVREICEMAIAVQEQGKGEHARSQNR